MRCRLITIEPVRTSCGFKDLAKKVDEEGAIWSITKTLAPSPYQNVCEFGAVLVLHSARKYLGGHSDLLAGVPVVKSAAEARILIEDQIPLGTNIGNLQGFLRLMSSGAYGMRLLNQI